VFERYLPNGHFKPMIDFIGSIFLRNQFFVAPLSASRITSVISTHMRTAHPGTGDDGDRVQSQSDERPLNSPDRSAASGRLSPPAGVHN